jgi:hypothetical protein
MNTKLFIPVLTVGFLDIYIQDMNELGLKKEIAIFLLGSLVYETPNESGERKFNSFLEDIPNIEEYKHFFLKSGILIRGQEENYFKYSHDLDHERYLDSYEFDSSTVQRILSKSFPNFNDQFHNVFKWLEPNIIRKDLPF